MCGDEWCTTRSSPQRAKYGGPGEFEYKSGFERTL